MAGSPSFELRKLIVDLGKIPVAYRRDVRPRLRKAALPYVRQVKANASWSTRIPKATRLQISFAARRPGVRVVVDPKKAPHGALYENDGKPGAFRAPLFGNRHYWYDHAARPFFYRPLEGSAEDVGNQLADIITEAAERHGFR